ncbi:hypothetical protein V8G61_05500 [Gaetbulibacter sp. M240]|uniref:hypothetical protein n=1 Tax=Gaetbulibacter sp. M240 TaxID=3126511 RepID=UPI00374F2B28
MKKITSLFGLMALLIFVGCQTEPLSSESSVTSTDSKYKAPEWDDCQTTASVADLYAGQDILVGNVEVTVDGDYYTITYNITNPDYCIKATHLSVEETQSGFPVNGGGNPQIGQFEYNDEHDCESTVSYEVPTSEGTYIAAHAVVTCTTEGSTEEFYTSLPAMANFCLTSGRLIDGAEGYFKVDIAEGPLSGSYWGWCADVSKSILSDPTTCYEDFNVLTLGDDISGIISQSDNIDNALWLLNNASLLLGEGYLYGNIQWAFWKLLNNQECNSCNANLKLPAGDITIAGMEIYNRAMTDGEGYSPECEENTMVILDDGVHQPIIIPVPIPCGDCDETAWADGCDFPGNQWATYFNYAP